MVTLIVEARQIPNGTIVRKVTGQNKYTLQREIKVFMPKDSVPICPIMTQGIVFLYSDRAINGYPDTTKLALDLTPDDAIRFLEGLKEENEH